MSFCASWFLLELSVNNLYTHICTGCTGDITSGGKERMNEKEADSVFNTAMTHGSSTARGWIQADTLNEMPLSVEFKEWKNRSSVRCGASNRRALAAATAAATAAACRLRLLLQLLAGAADAALHLRGDAELAPQGIKHNQLIQAVGTGLQVGQR